MTSSLPQRLGALLFPDFLEPAPQRPGPGYQGGKPRSRLALPRAVPGEAGAKGPAEGLVHALAVGLLSGW